MRRRTRFPAGGPVMIASGDVAVTVASETITAVIGDLEHALAAIRGAPDGRQAGAVMLGELAEELADLARALQRRPGP